MKFESSTRDSRNRCGLRIAILAVSVASMLIATVGVGAASAATYQYCSGCTIYASNPFRYSNVSKTSDLSYVHRLSGPSPGGWPTGTQIGAAAFIDNGPLICSNNNYVWEITCPPDNYYVRGRAYNGGAGNYGFNAHLRY